MKISDEAIARRLRSSLEELLLRPMDKDSDIRRLPRSTPGMRDFLSTNPKFKNDLKSGKLQFGPYRGKKSNPVRRA
jgi:hypothetical protein